MKSRPLFIALSFCVLALLCSPLLAQTMKDVAEQTAPAALAVAPPTFGTSAATTVSVPSYQFQAFDPAAVYTENGNAYRWISSAATLTKLFIAPVEVPSGVTITGFAFNYCDSNATGDYTVTLFDSFGDNNFATISTFSPTDRTGCGYAFAPAFTYNFDANAGHMLSIYVFQPNITDGTVKFRSAEVSYKRRVSPGPATATFADVSNASGIYRFVEALAAAGITGGCGGGNYCPNDPVTRGQMAVFLSVALGLHFPN